MAETSWPTTAGSRIVDDAQYEHLAWAWGRADGILGNPGDTAVVYGDSSGRQVKVRSGKRGHVRGRGWYSGTSDNTITIAANASGSTRIDVIVLRLTRSTWAVTAAVIAGTPGAGTPAITQDATGGTTGVWEVPLAVVTVANGAATISAGNVADTTWFSHGATIVTSSTAGVQPTAAAYTSMRHFDTGHLWETVSGAWRLAPWQSAWGVIGGRRYTAGSSSAIVTGGGTSEFASSQSSGSVSLRANRRYRIRAFVRLYTSVSTAWVILRVRETNLAGTIRAEKLVTNANQSVIFDWEVVGEYTTSADETKTYVVTGQSSSGTWNIYAGTAAANMTGVFVEDVGPSSPNVITAV